MKLALCICWILISFQLNSAEFHYERVFSMEKHHIEWFKNHSIPGIQFDYRVENKNENFSNERFFGYADVENDDTVDHYTLFRVAQLSQAIGSSLIGKLVEEGSLDWDKDIHAYLSETIFPKKKFAGKPVSITLRHLITHQAGIRSQRESEFLHDWEFRIKNSTQVVAWFAKDPLLFAPGTEYHYSDHSWSLIGAVVEAVKHRSYHLVFGDFMKNVSKFTSAIIESKDKLINDRGRQYRFIDGKLQPAPITDNLRPYPHWPAGNVLSNSNDLLVFGRDLMRIYNNVAVKKPLLKQSTVKTMWEYSNPKVSVVNNISITVLGTTYHNITSHHLLGWHRQDFPDLGKNIMSHLQCIYQMGQMDGVSAILAIFPKQNFIFSAIVNCGGFGEDLLRMSYESFYWLFHNLRSN